MAHDFSDFDGKSVLITGHTGFKGGWLGLWLNSLGANVFGYSNEVPTSPSLFELAAQSAFVEDIRGDICDFVQLQGVIDRIKPDFIFHLAAQSLVKEAYSSPFSTFRTNTMGTITLLEVLRFTDVVPNVVLITSDKSYRNLEWEWGYRETDVLGGEDPYSGSKAAAELAIYSYVQSYFKGDAHANIAVARAGNVIGGGDWSTNRIVPDCIRSWVDSEPVILRSPKSTRPWQHVLEPLSGYLTLALQVKSDGKIRGEAFNFGPLSDTNVSVQNLVESMQSHWIGANLKIIDQPKVDAEAQLLKLNCDKALFHLGWNATLSFEQTIDMTMEWYLRWFEGSDMKVVTLSQIEEYTRSRRSE